MAGAGGLALTNRSRAAKPSFIVLHVGCLTLQVVDNAETFGPSLGNLDFPLLRAGFDITIRPDVAVVADQAFKTRAFPLESVERAAIPTRIRPGVGCVRASLDVAKQLATELPDDAEHELATCYSAKGLG
jgi:hypothetical protein